jgi:type IV secretory pathway VirB10-like protein
MKNALFAMVAVGVASIAAIAATTQFLNNAANIGPAAQPAQTTQATPPTSTPAPDAKPASAPGGAPATPGTTPPASGSATAPAAGTPDAKPADDEEGDKDPYEGIAPEELPPDLQYNADSSVSFPTNI